jgi:predicted Zn finger-like uncharacterized protein
MILTCPSCSGRYLISANVFSAGPRQVRCARCTHTWRAELPRELDAVGPAPDADLTPPPDAVAPIPPGSNLPVIRREPIPKATRIILFFVLPAVALAVLLAVLVLDRHEIAETWPRLEPFYEKAGLHIYHYGEDLSFLGVRSELRYDSGRMFLDAEGRIHNSSRDIQQIPPITATAIGVDGKAVQSWHIDPPAATVAPGEDVPFRSSIDAPQDSIAEINLSFVEKKDDAGQ